MILAAFRNASLPLMLLYSPAYRSVFLATSRMRINYRLQCDSAGGWIQSLSSCCRISEKFSFGIGIHQFRGKVRIP
ncbi:hypothetical protein Y032_0368g47 [Ancylostoma ceylanicum]|uniref:Uncharacterized protein n=1 Tax=Ancylostoma ceylanicum TaxID=53326 RepID=A0A016RVN4_9BILA|nr:hypothetical protein Y032_0368g47 [Ancylostoma ceylanicum]